MMKKTKGFMLIYTLFILVILAMMGITLTKLFQGSSQMSLQALVSANVRLATRSGMEWGIAKIVSTKDCFAIHNQLLVINDVNVALTCTASTDSESVNTIYVFMVGVTGEKGSFGSSLYGYRHLETQLLF